MSTHRSRFFASQPVERLYDWTRAYFESREFAHDALSERPRVLFMRRGTTLGRHNIKECRTDLRVSFQPEGNEVGVECHYDIRATDLLMSDHDFLEQEVEGLRRALLAHGGGRKCSKCGSPLAAEFQMCPYCGEKPSLDLRCPGCKKTVSPEFNFCPGCGADLKTAERNITI